MFEKPIDYPCALSQPTDEGLRKAAIWAYERLSPGQIMTMWVPQKNVIRNNEVMTLLAGRRDVEVAVGRGGSFVTANGPVLACYPDAADLGKIMDANKITALAVHPGRDLRLWAHEAEAELLEDEGELPEHQRLVNIDPLPEAVVAELEKLTQLVSQSNTLSESYNKGWAVQALLKLKDQGMLPDPDRLAQWAAAHGWIRGRPGELEELAKRIKDGIRPRSR